MAAHLEANSGARAVINFVPVLLEQIEDYRIQLDHYLNDRGAIRDPLLSALADPVQTHGRYDTLKLIKECLRANEIRLINRFPAYKKLASFAQGIIKDPDSLSYFGDQFLTDLIVWYHLAWMGETVRLHNKSVQALILKERHFTLQDRRILLEVIMELVSTMMDRYQRLAEKGQIELSMTPYAHPISPLLIDFNSAVESMPGMYRPNAKAYPGGIERNKWHIEKGLKVFEEFFGIKPSGCWPAEGGISEATVDEFTDAGFSWFASGDAVLKNSLRASGKSLEGCIHSAYRLRSNEISGFFRDDGISDMIGFKFQDWHADDAVANIIDTLLHIKTACKKHPAPIVSIILDGENAWEHYPKNGYYFLSALYRALAKHESIKLTTYSEYLQTRPHHKKLDKLVAGSWVYGTFSTWIGSSDKNRAWDMLVDAKQVYDEVIQQGQISAEAKHQAQLQLATCESSDWFWWFGDYNPAQSVKAFDELYRMHLRNLYQCLNREPPEYLSHHFSFGSKESDSTGVIMPGNENFR